MDPDFLLKPNSISFPHLPFLFSVSSCLKLMMANHTSVTEFILLGLTDDINFQALLFLFLLLTYILSVMGNSAIILLTLLDYRLQTPMYFFLRNFAFLEISFTSVFVPKMLVNIGTGNKTISFAGCFTQYFFCHSSGSHRILPLSSYIL